MLQGLHCAKFVLWWVILSTSFAAAASSRHVEFSIAKVEANSGVSQQKLLSQALRQIIVKMTGTDDALNAPPTAKLLSSAQTYLRAYRYEEVNNKRYFVGEFDSEKLAQRLIDNGHALWGNPRADTLLWMVVEQRHHREIVTDERTDNLTLYLKDAANQRGLPVTLPLMDLADAQRVSVSDVWGRFVFSIREASVRYGNQDIVIARVYQPDPLESLWRLDWTYITPVSVTSGTEDGDSAETAVAAWVSKHADAMSRRDAVLATEDGEEAMVLTISVANLDALATMVDVEQYLGTLGSVKDVRLAKVVGTVSYFRVALLGSEQDWRNLIQLQRKLVPVGYSSGDDNVTDAYYWNP